MSDEFDVNKQIAEFANYRYLELKKTAHGKIAKIFSSIKAITKPGLQNYLRNLLERQGKIKSLFIRDEPTYLYDLYVPVDLSLKDQVLEDSKIDEIRKKSPFVIIEGTGGAGKTVLLKHLLWSAFKEKQFIPVFIELREFNIRDLSLLDFALETVNQYGLNIDEDCFCKLLTAGEFVFLLDGFDETLNNQRKELIAQVNRLTTKYKNINVILTTRPDEHINSFKDFTVLTTCPLSKRKCIQLVRKLSVDQDVQHNFIKDLDSSLYEKHKSFLSNPLLLTMMLVTYRSNAEIPHKLTVFYNQAYEALFQKHDAYKGSYKRQRWTLLDISDFEKVFSTFCILTYNDRMFKFSESEALKYLQEAKELTNIQFVPKNLLMDLQQSVCMLVEDGLFLIFAHRSFQEYFVTKYLSQCDDELKKELLEQYFSHMGNDSVYKLYHELDTNFLEFEVLLPKINKLLKQINFKKTVGITVYFNYLKKMWRDLSFHKGRLMSAAWADVKAHHLIYFTLDHLSYLIKDKPFAYEYEEEEGPIGIGDGMVKVTSLTRNSPIVKYLYGNKTFFSKDSLEDIIAIRNALEKKKKTNTKNLNKLLRKSLRVAAQKKYIE